MLALSIRQPWAHLFLYCGKDVENRSWPTKVRGRVLVHAFAGMVKREFDEAIDFADYGCDVPEDDLPDRCDLLHGGIVGSVEIVDRVTRSDSRWFVGEYGFVLRDPRPITFRPCRGRIGFFDAPKSSLVGVGV